MKDFRVYAWDKLHPRLKFRLMRSLGERDRLYIFLKIVQRIQRLEIEVYNSQHILEQKVNA